MIKHRLVAVIDNTSNQKVHPVRSYHANLLKYANHKKFLKHLGIRLYPRLAFWAQIEHAAEETAKMASLVIKLMANLGEPTQRIRDIIIATTWVKSAKSKSPVYNEAAIRVVSTHCTVSRPAVEMKISSTYRFTTLL